MVCHNAQLCQAELYWFKTEEISARYQLQREEQYFRVKMFLASQYQLGPGILGTRYLQDPLEWLEWAQNVQRCFHPDRVPVWINALGESIMQKNTVQDVFVLFVHDIDPECEERTWNDWSGM